LGATSRRRHFKDERFGGPPLASRSTTSATHITDAPPSSATSAVGLEWQSAGIAPVHSAGSSDLVLRNVNTGAFEVYGIAGNTLVGLDWQFGGFAADPPTASMSRSDGSTSQLVQAMAGFGDGAADDSNAVSLEAETSRQTFLTTPHA
jgi:hypothetical protein